MVRISLAHFKSPVPESGIPQVAVTVPDGARCYYVAADSSSNNGH